MFTRGDDGTGGDGGDEVSTSVVGMSDEGDDDDDRCYVCIL